MLQLIYVFIKHSRGETKHVPECASALWWHGVFAIRERVFRCLSSAPTTFPHLLRVDCDWAASPRRPQAFCWAWTADERREERPPSMTGFWQHLAPLLHPLLLLGRPLSHLTAACLAPAPGGLHCPHRCKWPFVKLSSVSSLWGSHWLPARI